MSTQTQYEKLPGAPPAYEEATKDVEAAPEAAEEEAVELDIRGRCFLHKFCYCLTLPTAVWLFAMLDLFHGVGSVFSACLLLLVKAEEPVIDKVLVKFFDGANATDVVAPDWFPFHANMTALETAQAVGGVNSYIDASMRAVPLFLVLALAFFWLGSVGIKASRGDAWAARRYFVWKMFHALFATLSFASLGSVLLSTYVAVACRSHWVVLVEKDFQKALAEPAAKPKAQEPAKTIN